MAVVQYTFTHTHTHTHNTPNDTKQTIYRTTKKFWKSAGRVPSLRVLPWHYALQLRKKHRKTSVRVAEEFQLTRWRYINIQLRIYRDNKNTYKQQLRIVYMSSNNVGHFITKTITTLQHFTTLHHTSLHLSTLHFPSFTLHNPLIWLNIFTFPIIRFHLTSLN